jgi:hypothetical protein
MALGPPCHLSVAVCSAGGWFNFDDSRVTGPLPDSEIVCPSAYLLFYRRREEARQDDGVYHTDWPPTPALGDCTVHGPDVGYDVRRSGHLKKQSGAFIHNDRQARSFLPALRSRDPLTGRWACPAVWGSPAMAAHSGLPSRQAPWEPTQVGKRWLLAPHTTESGETMA